MSLVPVMKSDWTVEKKKSSVVREICKVECSSMLIINFNICMTVHLLSMVKKRANWIQQWWSINKFKLASHVSGNSFAHHQEH